MKKKKQGTASRIFSLAAQNQGVYFLGVTSSAFGTILSAVPFFTVYQMIKTFLISSLEQTSFDEQTVLRLTIITIISILVGVFMTIIGGYLCHKVAFQVQYGMRMKILDHIGQLNLGFYNKSRSGELQKMMSDNINQLEQFLSHIFPNMIGAGLLLSILTVFMLSLNLWLTLSTLLAVIIAFVIQFSAFGGSRGKARWVELNQSQVNLSAEFSEYIKGMKEEKIFGNPDSIAQKLTHCVMDYREQMTSYLKRTSPIFGAYKVIILSLLAFILPTGILLLNISPNNTNLMIHLFMFLIVGPAIYNPMMELVEFGSDMKNIEVRLDQIDEILKLPTTIETKKEQLPDSYDVVLKDVSFSYQSPSDPLRRMALDHISLTIPQGKLTAIVGPSGGGKTTIGQLITRFWDVEQGSITIGTVDIRDIHTENLMNMISFVFQDTHIFSQTVRENISMNHNISMDEIIQAGKSAQIHDFIMTLPNGYDTKLGDGGHQLSGGEAQRIAIARAMLKNAPIVILDEAMAFSDAENEALLQRAMATLLKDKTVLMIAHRLYSIRHADHIVVIDNGAVKEQGLHDKLIMQNGLYTHLWNTQSNCSKWTMKGGI